MKRFIDYLVTADLKATKVPVFDTYAGRARPIGRAVKKLESMVQVSLTNLKLVLPGLSVRVNGMKGPVMEAELSGGVEFRQGHRSST